MGGRQRAILVVQKPMTAFETGIIGSFFFRTVCDQHRSKRETPGCPDGFTVGHRPGTAANHDSGRVTAPEGIPDHPN